MRYEDDGGKESLLCGRGWAVQTSNATGRWRAIHPLFGTTREVYDIYALYMECDLQEGLFHEMERREKEAREFRSECMYGGQLTPFGGWK